MSAFLSFNPKFWKFRLVYQMEWTISFWSDRNIRDQLRRWSTLTGLDISVGRTEMSLFIWQNCCAQYLSFVFCLQEQYPNARWLGLGLYNRNIRLPWAWNFRNFKPGFLLNGKPPMSTLCRIAFRTNMKARRTRTSSHTSSIVPERLARERVLWTNSSLLNSFFRPSQRFSSSPLFFSHFLRLRSDYLFTLQRRVAETFQTCDDLIQD